MISSTVGAMGRSTSRSFRVTGLRGIAGTRSARANPLVMVDAGFRKKLIEERDAARADTRLKARFLSYRLNLPTADEADTLLTVEDVETWLRRPVPERAGAPMVALDIGGGRAWSAAVAVWENGRVEAYALSGGVPDIAAQERRDRVPDGTYQRLVEIGVLGIAEGLEVPPVVRLWDEVVGRWGMPVKVICDRFKLPDLRDAVGHDGCPISARGHDGVKVRQISHR